MATTYTQRHALGLPAGSVRAILTLMVVGLLCLVLLVPTEDVIPVPPYLVYLLFIGLGHFFAAHGSSIAPAGSGQASPLYLPAGFVRLLITLLLVGVVTWKLVYQPGALETQWQRSLDELRQQPYLPLLLLAGFFFGVVFRWIIGRTNPPYVVQDLEAWISLLAVMGLTADAVIHLIINPTLPEPLVLPNWGGFLAIVVAFYFGARS